MAENIEVIFRVRPRNAREISEGDEQSKQVVNFKSQQCIEMNNHIDPQGKPNVFNFDHVVPPEWSQAQVYSLVAPMLDRVFEGVNCCLMTYGQTGAGKSFSIMGKLDGIETGTMPELAGIVPRLVTELFERVSAVPDTEFTVKFSYVEIYNEQIRDLLDTSKSNLKVRAQNGTVWCEGASLEYVRNVQDVIRLIDKGTHNRAVSSTLMNAESSRSHSIITITVGQRNDAGICFSKLVLVDLAGSERVSKTAAAGDTLKEAQNINRSLAVLGNVINALSTAPKKGEKIFVPVRESKLTWMLSDCLGGSSKTTILIAASPVLFNLPETYSSASFGSRCKLIKNKITVNKHLSEAEWQRLLDSKTVFLNKMATILNATYSDYNLLAQHVSTVNVEQNEEVSNALLLPQKGYIAQGVQPHAQRHPSWDKYSAEYTPSLYDIPLIVQTIQKNGDLSKVLDKIAAQKASGGDGPLDLTLTTTPKPRFTYTPDTPMSPSAEGEFTSIDPNMPNPSYIDDITDPVDRSVDELDAMKLSSPEFMNSVEQILANNRALDSAQTPQSSTTNNNNNNNNNNSTTTTSTTPTTNNLDLDHIDTLENITGDGDRDGLLSHTTRHRSSSQIRPDQLPNLNQLKTPTDSLVEILREYFKTDLATTQELLDLLLQCPDGSTLPMLIKHTIQQQLLGHPPQPVAAVNIPTNPAVETGGKQQVVKKKVVKKVVTATPTALEDENVTTAGLPTLPEESSTPTVAVIGEDGEEADVAKAGGKKVVKKVIKKVVRKSEKPTSTVTTPVVVDEASIAPLDKPASLSITPEEQPEEEQHITTVSPTTTTTITTPEEILLAQQQQVDIQETKHTTTAINNDPVLLQEMDALRTQLALLQAQLNAAQAEKVSLLEDKERLEVDVNNKNDALLLLKTENEQNLSQLEVVEEEKRQHQEQLLLIQQQQQQQQQQQEAQSATTTTTTTTIPPVVLPPVKTKPPVDMVPKTRYQELQQEYIKLKHENDREVIKFNALKKALTKKQEDLILTDVRLQSLWNHSQDLERTNSALTTETQKQKEKIADQEQKLQALFGTITQLHKAGVWWRGEVEKRELKINELMSKHTQAYPPNFSKTSSYQDLKKYF